MSNTFSSGEAAAAHVARSRVTLQMIARQLAVSTATVSLALRDSPLVADQTKRDVKKAASDLGYIQNRGSIALKAARTNIIAVALHDILNPYFAEILVAIEQRAVENGRTVMFGHCTGDSDRQERVLSTLRLHRPDGLLLCPTSGTQAEHLDPLIACGIPVVQIVREIEETGFDFVGVDDEQAATLAVEHLVSLGHTRIAMLGGSLGVSTGRARHAGYARAMQAAGLSCDASLHVQGAETREAGINGAHWLLERRDRPTAIYCCNDLTALGAMVGMRQQGIEPGRDVSIIGGDDIAEAAASFPGLTTVRGCHVEMVRKAFDIVAERIDKPTMPPKRIRVAPSLIVRGTTARAAA
jgi:LacI family transcriptional regulator